MQKNKLKNKKAHLLRAPVIAAFATLLVTGCSWNALHSKPSVAAVHVALSDYQKPHAGKYLLYISGDGLDQNVEVGGLVCTSHDYAVQASNSFKESVRKTLGNVVETIEVVPATMTQQQVKAVNAHALINIQADKLAGQLLVSPGFLTKDSVAKIQISAHVKVLKKKGKVFDKFVSSEESASLSIGRCLDAHKPVSAASSNALKKLVDQIGTTVSQALSSKK